MGHDQSQTYKGHLIMAPYWQRIFDTVGWADA